MPRLPVDPSPEEPVQLIGAEGTEAPDEPRRSGEARNRCLDEMLDAALACTFPASDPIGCLRVVSECEDARDEKSGPA